MEQPPPDGALAGSPYPPIADYALLSDFEVSALVAPSGSIEWMCAPRMDGPSVFGAMPDRDAGGFKVAPQGQRVPAGRRYLPGTNILETTWATKTGWVTVVDLLLIGPWHHDQDRSSTHRRSPTDTVGITRAEGHDVELRLTTDLRLGFERGRARARSKLREGVPRPGAHGGAFRREGPA